MAGSWPDKVCTWYFEGGAPDGISEALARTSIALAALTWPGICGIAFVQVSEPGDARVLVLIESTLDASVERMPGQAAAWAAGTEVGLTDEPVAGVELPLRMRLNQRNCNGWTGDSFLQTAQHEFGHAIGIDHQPGPSIISEVENPEIFAPQPVDIAAGQALYGPPPGPQLTTLTQPKPIDVDVPAAGTYILNASFDVTFPGAGKYTLTPTLEPKS